MTDTPAHHDQGPEGADETLAWLGPIPGIMYRAIEYGVEEATAYFLEKQRPIRPLLFASLVRFNCIDFLEREEFNSLGFVVSVLMNDGVEVVYNGYRLHVWKADNDEGELPAPRGSENKAGFYLQTELYPFTVETVTNHWVPIRKLVVTWEFAAETGLIGLNLICPLAPDGDWKPGIHHWSLPIPHPITQLDAATEFAAGTEDLGDDQQQPETGTEGQ